MCSGRELKQQLRHCVRHRHGGVMGRGIAYVAAQAGMQVDLVDVSDEMATKGRDAIAKSAERDAERGRLRGGAPAGCRGSDLRKSERSPAGQ